MITTLPQHEPVDLKRSPIALAVVQLRFPTILSIQTDEKLVANYQDKVRGTYPYFFTGQQVELVFGPQGITQQPAQTRQWQFKDSEQRWNVTVAANAITLETRFYTNIEEFADRMLEVLLAAKETFGIEEQERIGLRYINEVRHPEVEKPADWRRFMNPALLGPLSDDAIADSVESTVQELRLTTPDSSVIVRHGAAQGTAVAPEPGVSPPQGQFYLLDLDAYQESRKELDVGTFSESMRGYNRTLYSLFRWGLNDQMFEYLKGAESD